MERYFKNYIVSSLLLERPIQYSFIDILPRNMSRLSLYNSDSQEFLAWVLVANDHRCLGGYEFKYGAIEYCFGEKALTCKDLKNPPTTLPGYEPISNSPIVDNSFIDLMMSQSFLSLINLDPTRYEFMEQYLPTYEVTSYEVCKNCLIFTILIFMYILPTGGWW